MIADLVAQAEKEKVKPQPEQLEKAKPLIVNQIKSIICRDIFDLNSFFKLTNSNNKTYLKAIEILRDDKQYNKLLHTK
jgi:hypothetical protein